MWKLLLAPVLLALLLGGAAAGYVYYRARASLPLLDGAVRLPGLSAPVEVLRDARGIPHIYGSDVRDLSRATGYVHAQDRYFQMELTRRLGAGRLAEVFGSEGLDHDRTVLRLGLATAAAAELERMAPEAREILEAYAGGVNAYRDARLEKLPPEFAILGLTPPSWRAVDSLVIAKLMAHFLSDSAQVETLRANLAHQVGVEAAYRLTGLEPPPVEDEAAGGIPRSTPRLSLFDSESPRFRRHPGASNAWVVSGERSVSGRPLLASDPHLVLGLPSVWYQIQLSGGGLEVAGASVPGAPLVIIGQNERIAWGATALFADVQDLYLETADPSRPGQYLAGEEWVDFDVVPVTIPVEDEAAATEELLVSRHGVVVGTASDGRWIAERWDALWNGDHVLALLRLNRAASWEEFTDALRSWSAPALSFVYADTEGNVGFFPAGQIPVRAGFDGTMPLDGSADEHEWEGAIPHELKPMIFNPEDGLVVSANHRMFPLETPYPLGPDTLADFRARRIFELLRATRALSLDDFERIQNDRYDASTEPILRYAVALTPADELERAAVERLRGWSGQMTDGPAPAIYQALYRRLVENTFRDELGDELFGSFLKFLQIGHAGGLHAVVDDETSAFWDDRETPAVEDRDRIFVKSLSEAVATLSSRMGPDISTWDWEVLHGVEFQHPLGAVRPLDFIFNRGPAPFGGSTFTIANAVVSLEEPFETRIGTSFRFLADLANLGASRSSVPTGASGHPLSPHYYDQNPEWLSGRSRPLLVDRAAVEGDAERRLLLQP